ncbi:LysR family transcriptional regulator [Micrococcus sp. FDAARGOS_333]|uniref:LysR family transcriptional regulator n=1 Tax=Micrococcus sp. FDAARGOS_333 TaxID=1930558 RepID=UPI001D10AAC1|nr:LysR family transcriptional regulator [Micrococcus sp. FDAARGOS_333]
MDRVDAAAHMQDLVTLLTVTRLGRVEAAAEQLGVNRTTVGRRVQALERALGGRVLLRGAAGLEVTPLGRRALDVAERLESALDALCDDGDADRLRGVVRVGVPEGFGVHFAAPALGRLVSEHPELRLELRTAPMRSRLPQAELDLEVTIGRPRASRAPAVHVRDYALKLFAAPAYLERSGTPTHLEDLSRHRLVYYVESDLATGSLDLAREALPAMETSVSATSVTAHVTATAAGAGIGLLPDYLAEGDERLVPVLADDFAHPMDYWLLARPEAWRNPAVRAVHEALAAA